MLITKGPDFQQEMKVIKKNYKLKFFSSVLSLRGKETIQPITKNSNSLQFNGEIFGGISVKDDENDGNILFNALTNKITTIEECIDVISIIKGIN